MKIRGKTIFLLSTLIALISISACSPKHIATGVVADIGSSGMISMESETSVEFARSASPALIKTLEVLRYGNKKNSTALTLLSKAYGQYAFGFIENDMLSAKNGSPEKKSLLSDAELFYRRGKEYGIAALIKNKSMKKAFKSHVSLFEKEVKKMGKNDVDALFWTSFNWANWLNLNIDDPSAIVDLPRIEAMVRRVIELNENFYFGSAHAILGTIAASRPEMLGGEPELAKSEFIRAMEISPSNLMTKVMYAMYYARRIQDKKLFEDTLNDVIFSDVKPQDGQQLSNALAKIRAKRLLEMKEEVF
ncbi:MAG TPA: TRAP transporter TatT component family protein [bacterium]|nr:TRAP transporter TatT component family protein [bacterium]